MGWGGGRNKGSTPPCKRVAWKKLRKERKKFSKLLIFSTDCSQTVGLQSVIKIRGKTSKLFALHASPYKGSTPGWILVTLKILQYRYGRTGQPCRYYLSTIYKLWSTPWYASTAAVPSWRGKYGRYSCTKFSTLPG